MTVDERKQNKKHRGWYSRGYLPHFDSPGIVQMITFRLADSIPNSVLQQIELEAKYLSIYKKRMFFDKHLDVGHGECFLIKFENARIVEDALLHFDNERYFLLSWVIMPNHVHVLVKIIDGYILSDIVHSWKRYSARMINRKLVRTGRLWQREYWDRYIRSEDHLNNAINYIHMNPVKAGFVDNPENWQFSSARRRLKFT